MKKLVKYLVTGILSAAAVVAAARLAGGAYTTGIKNVTDDINAGIEAKRQALISTGVFHDGITVSGIPIGGMTYDEAAAALAPVEKQLTDDIGFTVKYGPNSSFEIDKSSFTTQLNTKKILGEAIMLASEGELESIRQEIDDIAKNGRNYTVECTISPNRTLINTLLNNASKEVDKDPVNAYCVPNPSSVHTGESRFTYHEGENGFRLNIEDAYEEIISRTEKHEFGTVVVEGEIIEPEIKVDDLKDIIVRRSHYKSSYAHGQYSNPNRVANIIKACGIVNGTVIPSKANGDNVFSINTKLGKRTEAGGWLPAPGFINGGANSVDSPGGGVCHVSSTMYNAVIRADLEIVYRINHSSHVGYVPWGLDATIDSYGPDFKFANNTGSDIYLFMWVDEKKQYVHCEIWGEAFPDEFDKIEFYAEQTEVIEPTADEYIRTNTLSAPYWYIGNGAKVGYKYQSYKQYYKDDKPVGDPVPVAESYYRMHPRRIYVWVGFNPAVDVLDWNYRISAPVPES